ncbi:HNH endonuclease [Devosia beringensis]|uniref:HNH endonuclease n=1 Tax=Devosia beringensis TaxID=2657486 RepID=UPI00186B8600|nr:HNH endonuclease signature motif containing protein [Devosia beringensis]
MSKLNKLRDEAFDRQGGLCWYCGRRMTAATDKRPNRRTAEHLLAQCDGGQDVAENIVAACWFCNTRRHTSKTPLSPQAYQDYVRHRLARGNWFNPKGGKPADASTPTARLPRA